MRELLILSALLTAVVTPAGGTSMYREEEIAFRSGAVTIAGTLTVPSGSGPFPAVVLLSGSGPQNRDSEVGGFRPFKLMAASFAERGIAVLRCDDRGVGGSTGTVAGSTSEDFADDALAAVRVLRGRPEIDAARIGLVGHSEGAIVAAIAASRTTDVRYIVWLAGSAVKGADILRLQAASFARAAGVTASAVDEILTHHAALLAAIVANAPTDTLTALARTLVARQLDALPEARRGALGDLATTSDRLVQQNLTLLGSPWMRFFIGFDPATALRRVACPVFAAFGGRDLQVLESANRSRLEAALLEARNRQVTVKVYEQANHLFMPAVTGDLAEYATLPRTFVPSLLDDIGTWIVQSKQ